MAVPDYQTFMLPVLRYAGGRSNEEIAMKALLAAMATEFSLAEDDLREMLPSGVSTTLGSRVGWACTYLKKAGLLEAPRRGHIKITSHGIGVLSRKPKKIDVAFLRQFPESGDEGIDGIIKEDKLGLDTIYIQAKRWKDNAVGRPAIQQFAGALAGQGAHKGIFITTSFFTDDARAFVSKVNSKIVLIDGDELANLMIDHGIGVATAATYEVKRVDSDYFAEEG
jgi:restriction endonuclease Mrr